MRKAPTEAERALWHILRAKRLAGWKWKRQQKLGEYIPDFVCFGARLIVEADGSQHANSDYDAARDAWLKSQGFRLLRFWNNDILSNPEGVAMAILAALESDGVGIEPTPPHPSPRPSPARGEGEDGASLNG
ncbi:endonuclease domain-containing protein [Sphingomonas aestuarii]